MTMKEFIHDEEPDTKNIIREDSDVEIDGYHNEGADVDAIHAMKR